MKKVLFFAVILMVVLLNSCGHPNSSSEEAYYIVSGQSDCERIVQVLSVEGFIFDQNAMITKNYPKIAEERALIAHIVIYQGKDSIMRIALLDDSRPPEIISGRVLK